REQQSFFWAARRMSPESPGLTDKESGSKTPTNVAAGSPIHLHEGARSATIILFGCTKSESRISRTQGQRVREQNANKCSRGSPIRLHEGGMTKTHGREEGDLLN
ncbi:hypothetical protein CEXT_777511, partial [Caerostris extrusa]